MPTGTIKKLVQDRGFGFIAAEDGKEYFFHRTGLDSSVNFDSLAGGQRVSFQVQPSQKSPRANRIKLAEARGSLRPARFAAGPFSCRCVASSAASAPAPRPRRSARSPLPTH